LFFKPCKGIEQGVKQMCHASLKDSTFYSLLYRVDQDLARKVREARCPLCGGALHTSDYARKPRGQLVELARKFSRRLSFCCAEDSCRRRATPPSVRFLGRKVYLSVVVCLITAMRQGLTPQGARRLKHELGVDRRTVERWRKWWQESLPQSRYWREARVQLGPNAPSVCLLPGALFDHFGAFDCRDGLRHLLRFLSPITTVFEISLHASLWPC
jgi:hypothetical protein